MEPFPGSCVLTLLPLFSQESYPAVPPIWSVESDDPNLAAVLERLVDIKKGNTLVRGQGVGWGTPFLRGPCHGDSLERVHLGADCWAGGSLKPEGEPSARAGWSSKCPLQPHGL